MKKVKDNLIIIIVPFLASTFAISILSVFEFSFNFNVNTVMHSDSAYITIMNNNYFEKNNSKYYFVEDYSNKMNNISALFDTNKHNITARLKYRVSIISAYGEYYSMAIGVDKLSYGKVFKSITNVIEGESLTEKTGKYSLIVSDKIALGLSLDIGSRVILRLITTNGYYKASEYTVIGISDSLNEDSVLLDLYDLANMANIYNAVSEIDINPVSLPSGLFKNNDDYNEDIYKIFGSDIKAYSLSEVRPDILNDYNILLKIIKYIFISYAITLFSVYIFISSKDLHSYKEGGFIDKLITEVIFSNLGFVLSIVFSHFFAKFLVTVFDIYAHQFKFIFERIHLVFFLINIIVIVLSNSIIYIYSRFIKVKENAL